MSSTITYPVQVFRDHLTTLEAAMTVCLADPDTRAVHRLRTETRRVEALLLLLALVPRVPEHRKQAAAFLRRLAKLRRAAGEVRDLDVHRKMLDAFLARHEGEGSKPLTNEAELSEAAGRLRKHMGAQREKAAAALRKVLEKKQVQTAEAAEDVMEVLEPAEHLPLNVADLLRDANSVLIRDGLLKPGRTAELTEDELHTVRKAAKAARYVAETVENDEAVAAAARGFEALQEAGGQWHDTLQLSRAARRHLGKDNVLTALYRGERNEKLAAYRAALTARAREDEAVKKRKPAKAGGSRRRAAA